MSSRKATIAISALVGIAILVFVLILILVGIFPRSGELSDKFFGISDKFFPGGKFILYKTPAATGENKIATDSMKALQCAMSIIASGKIDSYSACEPGDAPVQQTGEPSDAGAPATGKVVSFMTGFALAATCSGRQYGQSCVQCEETSGRVKCNVNSFELPQEVPSGAVEGWAEFLLIHGDPQWIAYYESFPQGEDIFWQKEMTSFYKVGLIVQGVSVAFAAVKPFKWTTKLISDLTNPINKAAKLAKASKIASDLGDAAKAVENDKKIFKLLDKLKKSGKDVEAIEAMALAVRSIKGKPAIAAAELVAGNVAKARTELFQLLKGGEEVSIDASGIIRRKTIISALTDATPPISDISGNVISVSGKLDDAGKAALKSKIAEVFKDSGDETIASIQKSIDDIPSDEVVNIDNLMARIEGSIDERALYGAAEKLNEAQVLLLMRKAGFRKMFSALAKDSEEFEKGMGTALNKMTKLKKTNPKMFEKMIERSDEVAKTFIDEKTGAVMWDALAGNKEKAKELEELFISGRLDSAISGIFDTAKDSGELRGIGRTLGAGFFDQALGTDKASAYKKAYQFAGCVAIPAAAVAGQQITDTDVGGAVAGLGAFYFLNKPCAAAVWRHKYPILFAVGYLAASMDAENQKYLPAGENILALKTPSTATGVIADEPTRFPLKSSGSLAASMYRDSGAPVTFYAASPCKTDYSITLAHCSDEVIDSEQLLVFTGSDGKVYKQPMRDLKPEDVEGGNLGTYRKYWWDSYNPEEKGKFINDGVNPGGSWFAGTVSALFSESGSEKINDFIYSDPDLHKLALKFKYDAYGDYDISAFYYRILEVFPVSTPTSYPEEPYSSYGMCREDFLTITDVNVLVKNIHERQIFIEQQDDIIVGQVSNILKSIGADIRSNSVISGKNSCFSEFIDGLVDFREKHVPGDIEPFFFKCSVNSLPELWLPGAYARMFLYALDGFANEDECASTIIHSYPNSDLSDDYDGWLKFLRGKYFAASWKSTDSWDSWLDQQTEVSVKMRSQGGNFEDIAKYDFFLSGFMDYAARQVALTTTEIPIEKVKNKDAVVKIFSSKLDISNSGPTVSDKGITDITLTPQCITVNPSRVNYADYNSGKNYCYADVSFSLQALGTVADVVGIAGGLAVTGLSGGAGAPAGLVITAGVADAASLATSLIIEKCGDWPEHNPNIGACFDWITSRNK